MEQRGAAPAVLATTRPIQNTHTGLDLSVPEYQEIRGKMMSGHVEYHIVVVTRLAAFKSAKHKPEDVVQFMVSKKYSEIEELYQRLTARYPQVSLPLLPRKVLFVGESDISERRAMFNDIMKFISKDEDLATSPELLEFLGTKSSSAVDFKGKNLPDDREKEDEENEALDFFKEEKTPDLISQLLSVEDAKKGEKKEGGDEEEEEILDPLGIIRTKKAKKTAAPPAKEEKPKLTIFEEEVDPNEGLFGPEKDFSSISPRRNIKESLKLFEDPDLGGVVRLGDSLLLPAACEHSEDVLSREPEEDTEELLRVEDDFEKLLEVTSKPKPKVPPKPPLPQKPEVAPRSTNSPSLAKLKENRIQTMNEVDILQYIQENESINNQDTSLF
ncbi:HCLS1-binding protein 3 isoform X1 [Ammospiza nelsoni]|uniref:HCLS1-binding protein 3 isoform X1 n=2 Tax=Ammospiza caudacuta TaxID=2857398 RepID=UPI0027393932|nr:HCLS1-binding protein 3 isoform X1 [Ammospiza caudacuta]XP_059324990.1 HCLS1-binding protein 3 isoform X1 [Ammospiza nelsoni]